MPDDFMKQLQLSKQIEQKAKEAAQARKAAEEKLAEAEAELVKVKSKAGMVSEAEELLTKADTAFKEKDYRNCLALAEESIKASRSKLVNWVEERFGSTRELISILQEREVPVTEISNLLAKVSSALGRGELDDAMTVSSEAAEKAAVLAKETLEQLIHEATAELQVLESHSVDVSSEREGIKHAEKALAGSNFLESLKEADSSITILRSKFKDDFLARVEEVKVTRCLWPEAEDLGQADEALLSAVDRMMAHDVDEAMKGIASAEEGTERAVAKAMMAHLMNLSSRAATVGQLGMGTWKATESVEAAKKAVERGDLTRAKVAVIKAESEVHGLELSLVAKEISKWSVKLRIARMVGADLGIMSEELEAAKDAVSDGDVGKALKRTANAHAALEESLAGYQDSVAKLVEFRQSLTKASALDLNVTEAVRGASLARRAALQRDFQGSAKLLRDSTAEVLGGIQAHYGKQVIRIEMGLAQALKMQGDVALESEGLDQVVAKIRNNDFTVVEDELQRLAEGVDLLVRDLAERAVEESRTVIDEYDGPTDRSEPTSKLAEADIALAESKFVEAYDMALEAIAMLKREEGVLIDSRFAQVERLLAIMSELDCDSVTLRTKLARARDLNASGDLSGAVRLAEEIVHFSTSIIKDVIQKEMVKVRKAISISKRKGVAVTEPDHVMKEAFDLLGHDKIEAAYERMMVGMDLLKEVNRLHHEAYDLIADVRALINEAYTKGIDVDKTEVRLEGAQSMFESGRYKESIDIARLAFHDIERQAAPHILPRMIAESREVFALGRKIRIDTVRAENQLDAAEQMTRKGEHVKALTMVKESRDQVIALMADALARDIAAARLTLEKDADSGRDRSSVLLMIEKADSLLGDRQYDDAWRIIELVKSELDQSTFMDTKATDYINQAEGGMKDLDELGIDSATAREVLKQAKMFQKQGNMTLATELAKKAFLIAAESAERIVMDRMARAEERSQLNGLASQEMSAVVGIRERIRSSVASHQFREAMSLIPTLDRELQGVAKNREFAAAALAKAEERAESAVGNDPLPEAFQELLAKARSALTEGSFIDSRALSERFLQDLASVETMKESRMKELRAIREDLTFLGDDQRRREISEMVDAAEVFLSKMDLERTSLHLRRARAALFEETGNEVGKSFEDLMLLHKVMDQMGIPRPPQEMQGGRSMKMYDIRPKDLVKLRGEVANVIVVATEGFNSKLNEARGRVEAAGRQGKAISASKELLERAASYISGERFPEAIEAMRDAERFIGVPDDVLEKFAAGREELSGILDKMKDDGIEVKDLLSRLEALEKDLPDDPQGSVDRLTTLGAGIAERLELNRPALDVEVELVERANVDAWTKALIKVRNNGGSRARRIRLSVGDAVDVKGLSTIDVLHPGESEVLRVEIMARRKGKSSVPVNVRCESEIDGKDCGHETEFEVLTN